MGLPRWQVFLILVAIGVLLYFFSFQLQGVIAKVGQAIARKVGTYTVEREYALQRYIFKHSTSVVAKFYNWVNEQLIAAGLKRAGVTPFGYIVFWTIAAIIATIVVGYFLEFGPFLTIMLFFMLLMVFFIMTRVLVSTKMEKKESDIMDVLDLLVPNMADGVVNAINRYVDNFPPSVQQDFRIFLSNINDRNMSMPQAMMILADNLGIIFRDFAQKALFYTEHGDPNMLDIFQDITETNSQRRHLRYINSLEFAQLRLNFLLSTAIAAGYFVFLMATDAFSRHFFLNTGFGSFLLLVMVMIIFGVLSYIATIKSQAL